MVVKWVANFRQLSFFERKQSERLFNRLLWIDGESRVSSWITSANFTEVSSTEGGQSSVSCLNPMAQWMLHCTVNYFQWRGGHSYFSCYLELRLIHLGYVTIINRDETEGWLQQFRLLYDHSSSVRQLNIHQLQFKPG